MMGIQARDTVRRGLVAVCASLLLLGAAGGQRAQAQSQVDREPVPVFRDVTLKQALEYVIATRSANLVYNSKLIEGHRVTCTTPMPSTDALLTCLLDDVPVTYTRTEAGTYVLTKGPQRVQTGSLRGTVVDDQTGTPLTNANVVLDGGRKGAATSSDGTFSFASVPEGQHRLVVSYVGYRTVVDTVRVRAARTTTHRVALHSTPVQSGSVVVNDRQARVSEQPSRAGIHGARLMDVGAVGTADVMRQASGMLGISRERPLADLHVQGGDAGEHQVRLDGVPVRNPVTLRRMVGAFSPLALGDLTVHKAGFGVEYGSALSGILSATHDLGTVSDHHLTARVDPFSANGKAHVDIPMSGPRPATVGAAVRTSLWDLYPNPTLNQLLLDWNAVDPLLISRRFDVDEPMSFTPRAQNSNVEFSDLHAKARIPLGAAHTLSASGYRGMNTIETKFFATEQLDDTSGPEGAMLADDRYHWTNTMANVRYEGVLGTRTFVNVQLRGSQHTLQRGYHMSYVNLAGDAASFATAEATLRERVESTIRPSDHNQVGEVTLDAEINHRPGPVHQVSGAVEVKRLSSTFYMDEGLSQPLAYEGTDWQVAGYVADEIALSSTSTLDVGARWTYLPQRQTVYLEPRFSVRREGTNPVLGDFTVHGAAGLYRQFLNRFDLSSASPTSVVPSIRFWLPVGPSHAPPKVYHVATGLTAHPLPDWTVEVESYYKHQPHLLALDYSSMLFEVPAQATLTRSNAIGDANGYAVGAGIAVQHDGERVDGSIRYEFSQSRRTYPSRFGDRMEPTPWNQPHRLTATSDISLGASLVAHFSWQGIWGRSWPFRTVYYNRLRVDEELEPFTFRDPSAQTLPAHTQLSAGLSYQYTWRDVTLQARADVLNVLDQRNVFDWGLQPTDDGYAKTSRTLPGRRPTLSITVQY